jgi:hydrogenase maturation protease
MSSASHLVHLAPRGVAKPLILGLGNPILTDDRVGLEVARRLHEELGAERAALEEASVGGLELLHVLEGWQRVVLVDSYIDPIDPGRLPPGELRELGLDELEPTSLALSPHTAGLTHCLELGRLCGLVMPEEVRVFVIGVADPYTFGEHCTPEVAAAIPKAVALIATRVFGPGGWGARQTVP